MAKMTKKMFWEALEKIGRSKKYKAEYDDDDSDMIRIKHVATDFTFCPITAVCFETNKDYPPLPVYENADVDYDSAARRMHLSENFAEDVAEAADFEMGELESKAVINLRIQLKKALRLK